MPAGTRDDGLTLKSLLFYLLSLQSWTVARINLFTPRRQINTFRSFNNTSNLKSKMSSETPSWLSNDQPSAVATGTSSRTTTPTPLEVDSSGTGTAGGSATAGGAAADDEKDLPGVILTMRLANMGAAAYLMTVSVSFSFLLVWACNIHFALWMPCDSHSPFHFFFTVCRSY